MIIIIYKVELTISYLNLSSVDSSWISKILYLTTLSFKLFKIIYNYIKQCGAFNEKFKGKMEKTVLNL